MTALIRMRLRGYAVTGRALAPLLAGLVVLGTLYGGGPAQAGEAYGASAAVLLPVLAWQTKMLLDVEPDTQRRLAAISVGSVERECSTGLLAAVGAALPVVGLAILAPWLLNGIEGPRYPGDLSTGEGVAIGIWAHFVLLPPAIAIGALASRAITRTAGAGVMVLAAGTVSVLVLGLENSPAPWLAPPVIAVTSYCTNGGTWQALLALTIWATFWTAAAGAAYLVMRRFRH